MTCVFVLAVGEIASVVIVLAESHGRWVAARA